MADEIIKLGGIAFKQNEVKNYSVKKDSSYSGDLFTVETTHGTYSYRETQNAIKLEGKERSIFGAEIKNCTLEKIKGTDKKDNYYINGSYVKLVDLSGDEGNIDCVTLQNNSRIGNSTLDNDDNFIFMQQTNSSSIKRNTKIKKIALLDKKAITEKFKNEIMSKLDTSKSKNDIDTIYKYLGRLIEIAQTLNGAKNLKPEGTPEQNSGYYLRIKERIDQMNDYAILVGSGLSVVQDSQTGLYKLRINNELFDIPARNVKIVTDNTEDGFELVPKIVDNDVVSWDK